MKFVKYAILAVIFAAAFYACTSQQIQTATGLITTASVVINTAACDAQKSANAQQDAFTQAGNTEGAAAMNAASQAAGKYCMTAPAS